MRVLSVGTDRALFEEGSASRARHEAYARRLGCLDIVVLDHGEVRGSRSRELSVTPVGAYHALLRGVYAFLAARKLPPPDLVTAQDPFEIGLVAWVIARNRGVPLHVQVHTDFLSPAFARHSFKNRIRRMLAGFVLRRAARVRVVSEGIKEGIRRQYRIRAPVSVLPIFVDVGKYAQTRREKHPHFKIAFLAIGRLEPEKNFTLAIEALAKARASGHDAGLTIVGKGSEEERLRGETRRLGLERYVEFAGVQGDISPYLARADALLLTSHYEGYGMVIVEALAARVPVIATDVGVAREAGAIVASPREFVQTVLDWISRGPRAAELHGYPYHSFDEYVEAYCADLAASAN